MFPNLTVRDNLEMQVPRKSQAHEAVERAVSVFPRLGELVEQYVSRALAFADFVYLLNKGQVVFVGEPSELHGDEIFERYLGVH